MDLDGLTRQLKKGWKDLGQFWKNRSKAQQRVLVILAASIVILSVAVSIYLNTPQYVVLYSDMTAKDAGDILTQLSDMKFDAKPQGDGTILIDKSQRDLARMQLAAAGYPRNSANLDILEQGMGFSMTEDDKAIFRRYQLQEDLQNAIRTFSDVSDVSVSLHLTESSALLINDQSSPATAAVILTLKPGTKLTPANVEAISQLLQKSVPDLKPEGVTIMDSMMNLLSSQSSLDEYSTANQSSLESQVRDQFKQQILSLLQPVFGVGNVLAEVNVRLNFDDQVVENIRFEPAENSTQGMVSAIETIRDVATGSSGASGVAGSESNTSEVPTYPVVGTDNTVYEKNSEKVNYEINTIKEYLTKAKGSISNLSVSVILNENAGSGQDYSENIKQLVSTAIGVDSSLITVQNMPFNGVETLQTTLSDYSAVNQAALKWNQTRFYIEMGLSLAAVLVFFFLIRFAFRKPKTVSAPQEAFEDLFPSLRRGADPASASGYLYPAASGASRVDLTDLDDKDQVSQYIDVNPELVANIIRNWLSDESR